MSALALLEAASSDAKRRSQRARRAALDILSDRNRIERELQRDLITRLRQLKRALQQWLLVEDLTDLRRTDLLQRLAAVDRLIADAMVDVADAARGAYTRAADLGDAHALEPARAADLLVPASQPAMDRAIVQATFDNTVDLLSSPMSQFATDIKVAVRRVALAGDSQQAALEQLRTRIGGQGFDAAAFRAERIVRTEVGRVFNQATYERLVSLGRTFDFLRKIWRATKDARTRTGHREAGVTYARGQGIPLADRFAVRVYQERPGKAPVLQGTVSLRFPLDPEAQPVGRLAAGATIMCRCSAALDFDLAAFAAASRQRVAIALQTPVFSPPPSAAAPEPAPAPRAKPVRPRHKALRRTTLPTPTGHQIPKE